MIKVIYLKKIKLFILRFIIAFFVISIFMVVTQDFQIFPGIVGGIITDKIRDPKTLPLNVTSQFIQTSDLKKLEIWYLPAKNIVKGEEVFTLIFHGNAENVESTFIIQNWLSNMNISSFSFDYRGFGGMRN